MVPAMFTGIVEEQGKVAALERREGALRLTIACEKALEGTALGDSIAVNGVCLTVVERSEGAFSTEAVPETLRCTNLGALSEGAHVNLERAVGEGRFFGGHYVQGHVDGTATVTAIEQDGEAQNYRYELAPALMRYIVPKGFVSVDGASLTVVDVGEDWFTVTLIPHTQEAVVMGSAGLGYVVNIEVDVLAKYVEQVLGSRLEAIEARLAKLEGA